MKFWMIKSPSKNQYAAMVLLEQIHHFCVLKFGLTSVFYGFSLLFFNGNDLESKLCTSILVIVRFVRYICIILRISVGYTDTCLWDLLS